VALINDVSVLIAEDEKELREHVVEYLQLFFETVYTASNGEEAIDVYLKKRPDIIITDINMPELDGLSMIERIRKVDSTTKIVVLSAHSEQEKLFKAIKLNLAEYLTKPVESARLKELLLKLADEIRNRDHILRLGSGYSFNTMSGVLMLHNENIKLTPREVRLLELLCKSANHSVSNEKIFRVLYEEQADKKFSVNAITSLIKRIRTKLPENCISNHYGMGYMIHTET